MQVSRIVKTALVFLLLASVIFIYTTASGDEPIQDPTSQPAPVIKQDTRLLVGSTSAPVTVVEYFDYKCPNCNSFHRTTGKEVEQVYVASGRVNFEIRIIPIIGPDSQRAGLGAYCANDQEKFIDYHNAVLDYMWNAGYASRDFSTEFEDFLTLDLLSDIVSDNGIDVAQLRACITSGKYDQELTANLELAKIDEIRGTPGFAVGEQSFVGSQPFSVFKTLIDIELGESS